MATLAGWVRVLGGGGAVANARRACEARREAEQAVDAVAARVAMTARTSQSRAA